MYLSEVENYTNNRKEVGLVSLEISVSAEDFFINKRKETYHVATEEEADKLILGASQDFTCVGHDKRFKRGKVNKKGEQLVDDTYIVVLRFSSEGD